MSELRPIREAIAARLEAIEELAQASPYLLSDPTPPAAHLFPTPVVYDASFQRGVDDWTFTVQVFVTDNAGDVGAQDLLDEFLASDGPRSVKAILEEPDAPDGSVTLGGLVDDLRVTRSEGYRIYQREGRASMLGSEWIVEVAIPGREEN